MWKSRHLGAVVLCSFGLVQPGAGGAQVVPSRGQQAPSPMSQISATPPQLAPAAGLENAWDVRKIITNLQNDTSNLQPLLRQINPQDWYDKKGAPSTYILQWQSAQQQLNDVLFASRLFSQKAESLSMGLDTYFRLEALEVTERALAEGVG